MTATRRAPLTARPSSAPTPWALAGLLSPLAVTALGAVVVGVSLLSWVPRVAAAVVLAIAGRCW